MVPIRKAIIIGSQSPGNTFLPGVERDPNRMASYLKSPNGGRWYDPEIIILKDPSRKEVLQLVRSVYADYVYVYFSGHGYTNQAGQRMLCLYRDEVSDLELLNTSPRQLVVADACRTHVARISGIPFGIEKWQYATGYSAARAAFDQYILQSPSGKLIVHAAEDDMSAYDDDMRNGGQFSLALLDSVYEFQQTGRKAPLHIGSLLKQSAVLLASRNVKQTPSVVYHQGNFTVPFGLVSPDIIPRPVRNIQPVNNAPGVNWGGILTAAGILLTVYAISQTKK